MLAGQGLVADLYKKRPGAEVNGNSLLRPLTSQKQPSSSRDAVGIDKASQVSPLPKNREDILSCSFLFGGVSWR